jgi:hypothetical protein
MNRRIKAQSVNDRALGVITLPLDGFAPIPKAIVANRILKFAMR